MDTIKFALLTLGHLILLAAARYVAELTLTGAGYEAASELFFALFLGSLVYFYSVLVSRRSKSCW